MIAIQRQLFLNLVFDLSEFLTTQDFNFLIDPNYDFTNCPPPPLGCDVQTFKAYNLLSTVFKKYMYGGKDGIPFSLKLKGLRKFLETNDLCGRWSWDVFNNSPDAKWADEYILSQMRYDLHKWLEMDSSTSVTLARVSGQFNTGPGASAHHSGRCFFEKLATGKLSTSKTELYRLYRECTNDTSWESMEKDRIRSLGIGVRGALHSIELPSYIEITEGSSFFHAPKTAEITRPAGTEPILEMLFQLGLGSVYSAALKKHVRIDLTLQQDINKALARKGSIDQSLCTLDLKGASDMLSCPLINGTFPPSAVHYMNLFRSDYTIESDVGMKIKLNMMSTMGNGFTFPMQTLFFVALIKAVYDLLGIKMIPSFAELSSDGEVIIKRLGNYSVFGDDIIVVKEAVHLVEHMLARFGSIVNDDKSYREGPFRESCGGDYYYGSQVRGLYIKDLKTIASRNVAINTTVEWSAYHKIPLPLFVSGLLGLIPKNKRLWVPRLESDDAGIKIDEELLPVRYKTKYKRQGYYTYLKYSAVKKRLICELTVNGIIETQRLFIDHSNGYLLAIMRGDVANGRYPLPFKEPGTVYEHQWCSTHSWVGPISNIDDGSGVLVVRKLDRYLFVLDKCNQDDWILSTWTYFIDLI